MTGPSGLAFYLRHKYVRSVAATADVIGAIKIWFAENFPMLKVSDDCPEHGLSVRITVPPAEPLGENFQPAGRLAQIRCWADRFEFHEHTLHYEDPNFFDQLYSHVRDYFGEYLSSPKQ